MVDASGQQPGPQPGPAPRWRRDLAVALVAVAATLAVVFGLGLGPDGGDDDEATVTGGDDPTATTGTATETTAPAEPEPVDTFEDGLHLVGRDIEPGRYIAVGLSGGCDWARLADTAGAQPIATVESFGGQAVVEIDPGDAAFRSQNCGLWERYTPPPGPPATTVTDGDWVVGEQVEPGSYQSDVAQASQCTWTRARGFSHTADQVVEAHSSPIYLGNAPPEVVELQAGDLFSSQNCEPWAKV